MTLRVELLFGNFDEQNYRCLFGEFLGLGYETHSATTETVRVYDDSGRELLIAADLFLRPRTTWQTTASLPREPIAWWDAPRSRPSCFGAIFPSFMAGLPSLATGKRSSSASIFLVNVFLLPQWS
jgi:hypothetical protein